MFILSMTSIIFFSQKIAAVSMIVCVTFYRIFTSLLFRSSDLCEWLCKNAIDSSPLLYNTSPAQTKLFGREDFNQSFMGNPMHCICNQNGYFSTFLEFLENIKLIKWDNVRIGSGFFLPPNFDFFVFFFSFFFVCVTNAHPGVIHYPRSK